MKIVILHRIPFEKIRYDQIIDHQLHEVYYVCLQGNTDDFPSEAKVIMLESQYFEPAELINFYAPVFEYADRIISRPNTICLPRRPCGSIFRLAAINWLRFFLCVINGLCAVAVNSRGFLSLSSGIRWNLFN